MKIGIISDSHKKSSRVAMALEVFKAHDVEFLIHAGDIVEVATLELLKNSALRYVAVFGNNDAHLAKEYNNYKLVQEPHYFKLDNTTFKLMHLPFYMTPDAEVVIYGHTHMFDCEYVNNTLFLNPGEVCARNKDVSEFILLETLPKEFKVTYFYRSKEQEAKNEAFSQKHFAYSRVKR